MRHKWRRISASLTPQCAVMLEQIARTRFRGNKSYTIEHAIRADYERKENERQTEKRLDRALRKGRTITKG